MDIQPYFEKWDGLLRRADWYIAVVPELKFLQAEIEKLDAESQAARKQEIYNYFEKHLAAQNIVLGDNRGYFDRERQPIDTVVIHHTHHPPGMTAEQLSAIELIRLYAPYFSNPDAGDNDIKGSAIFSGHARNGRQVFWPYHWIVRGDGSAERFLEDGETGWHAGNWDINCRSIAIVFDNNYEHGAPSDVELRSAAAIIKNHYPAVPRERILGHREVNPKTICPSNLFISTWKETLLRAISE